MQHSVRGAGAIFHFSLWGMKMGERSLSYLQLWRYMYIQIPARLVTRRLYISWKATLVREDLTPYGISLLNFPFLACLVLPCELLVLPR